MRFFWKFMKAALVVIMVLWELAEILAIPALFFVVGLWNDFGYMYYIITIGGYFLVLALAELVGWVISKAVEKKYTPFLGRWAERFLDIFQGSR